MCGFAAGCSLDRVEVQLRRILRSEVTSTYDFAPVCESPDLVSHGKGPSSAEHKLNRSSFASLWSLHTLLLLTRPTWVPGLQQQPPRADLHPTLLSTLPSVGSRPELVTNRLTLLSRRQLQRAQLGLAESSPGSVLGAEPKTSEHRTAGHRASPNLISISPCSSDLTQLPAAQPPRLPPHSCGAAPPADARTSLAQPSPRLRDGVSPQGLVCSPLGR